MAQSPTDVSARTYARLAVRILPYGKNFLDRSTKTDIFPYGKKPLVEGSKPRCPTVREDSNDN